MTIPFTIIFAYGSTSAVSAATNGTYVCAWAKVTSIDYALFDKYLDFTTARSHCATKLRLEFKIGRQNLIVPASRTFFKAFFAANYKWVVYGDFKDTANSGYNNLCQCEISEDFNQDNNNGNIIDVSMLQDQSGYALISTGAS